MEEEEERERKVVGIEEKEEQGLDLSFNGVLSMVEEEGIEREKNKLKLTKKTLKSEK